MQNVLKAKLEQTQKGVLVEREASVYSTHAQLCLFETIINTQDVRLEFGTPVVGCMVNGSKVIRMDDLGAFEYKPGETLIIPANQQMSIDFTQASQKNPTQCIALLPEPELIDQVMLEFYQNTADWEANLEEQINFGADLLEYHPAIHRIFQHLLFLFSEQSKMRDTFVKLSTKELIIRLLQSKAREVFLSNFQNDPNNRMSFIAQYIKEQIHKPFTVQELAELANMSKSNFFMLFKSAFGLSPKEYIIQEKIKKAKLLLTEAPDNTITAIALKLGYSDSSYFTKQFKSIVGFSPNAYRKMKSSGQQS